MTRFFKTVLLLVVLSAFGVACSSAGSPDETQEKFGVRMARMNLWREALFRFQRAVEIDPDDAMAHNNLAVAYEANGDFENAGKQYREAMRLDKANPYIQKNYSRYVEFTSRNKKREQQQKRAEEAAAAASRALDPVAATTTTAPAEPAAGGASPAAAPAPQPVEGGAPPAVPPPSQPAPASPPPLEPQPQPQPQPQVVPPPTPQPDAVPARQGDRP